VEEKQSPNNMHKGSTMCKGIRCGQKGRVKSEERALKNTVQKPKCMRLVKYCWVKKGNIAVKSGMSMHKNTAPKNQRLKQKAKRDSVKSERVACIEKH
jgi:hypothetical protein